jgi:hypothetical protein
MALNNLSVPALKTKTKQWFEWTLLRTKPAKEGRIQQNVVSILRHGFAALPPSYPEPPRKGCLSAGVSAEKVHSHYRWNSKSISVPFMPSFSRHLVELRLRGGRDGNRKLLWKNSSNQWDVSERSGYLSRSGAGGADGELGATDRVRQ